MCLHCKKNYGNLEIQTYETLGVWTKNNDLSWAMLDVVDGDVVDKVDVGARRPQARVPQNASTC